MKVNLKRIAMLFFIAAFAFSCNFGLNSEKYSAYNYTGYDTSGVAIVKGELRLNYEDNEKISGDWHLIRLSSAGQIGPQTGSGNLIGGYESDGFWIELQPAYIDNNVQLTGSRDDTQLNGKWIWITFAGITNHGTFTAKEN